MAFGEKEFVFRVGQKVTLVIRSQKFELGVRGWKPGQFIILDAPMTGGTMDKQWFTPHTGIEAHITSDGIYVTFKSEIVHANANITAFLAITYPRDFKIHKLRKSERRRVLLSLTYATSSSGSGGERRCTARDISYAGALLTFPEELEKGSKVFIRGDMEQGAVDRLEAIVQNIRHHPKFDKEPWVIGVKFSGLSEENRRVLQRILEVNQDSPAESAV